MSDTVRTAHLWGKWVGKVSSADTAEYRLVGFSHQCGSATLVSDFAQAADLACPGCHFVVEDPAHECTPIFGHFIEADQ